MTFNVWVAFGAWRTRAGWLMVLGRADGSGGTSVVFADRPAHTVESVTGLVVGTVLIVLTDDGHAGQQGVALGAGRTHAGASVRGGHLALGAPAARHGQTGRHAGATHTCLVVQAVVVHLALRFVTLNLRVAGPAIRTVADGPMLTGRTLCVESTWVSDHARVLATLVDTRSVGWAFRVRCAFR